MRSSYYWTARMGKLGVTENRVFLGLQKVTATRQHKADHPLTHKATKTEEYPEIQRSTKNIWGKGRNRKVVWTYICCEKYNYSADNQRKAQEERRQRNPDFRMNIDPKKFVNQKKCIMKNKKITQQEIEEIARKSEKQPKRKRGRRGVKTLHHEPWWTETELRKSNTGRNGKSSTNE